MTSTSIHTETSSSYLPTLGLPEEAHPWFAIRVRSNADASVAHRLEERGIEVFFPTIKTVRQWSDRKRTIELPLFSGYLFCRTSANSFFNIISTTGVVGFVGVGRTPTPVPLKEIEAVRTVLLQQQNVFSCPYLAVGQTVWLIDGPLKGMNGLFVSEKNKARLIVSISLLQRSLAVEIDSRWVSPQRPNWLEY